MRVNGGLHSVNRLQNVPVRMVWKADSTFDASSADVSINDRPFSAIRSHKAFSIFH